MNYTTMNTMSCSKQIIPFITFSLFVIAALLPLQLLAQDDPHHQLVPFETIPSEEWIEVLSGDPGAVGEPFVIRIYNDAGFVVWPHTHPEDEHIVVIAGTWAFGKGPDYDPDALERMEVGDYAMVPRETAHFGYAVTDMTIQVHGTGPFAIKPVHPVYELTDDGVRLHPLAEPTSDTPEMPDDECFHLEIGEHVRGELGEGAVVGAHCVPAIEFTQYWVEEENGRRFWSTLDDLTKL